MRNNLKNARKARNLTQAKLSETLNMGRKTYTDIERGNSNPTYESMKKLSEFFGMSVDYLFYQD